MAKVADHVRKKHGVKVPTETIVSYVRSKAKQR
jgi:predicted small metal-binding protein